MAPVPRPRPKQCCEGIDRKLPQSPKKQRAPQPRPRTILSLVRDTSVSEAQSTADTSSVIERDLITSISSDTPDKTAKKPLKTISDVTFADDKLNDPVISVSPNCDKTFSTRLLDTQVEEVVLGPRPGVHEHVY